MKAVVLAAGEGTRLRGLGGERPKVLLEVGGEPLLDRGLRALAALDPEGAVLVVGHGEEAIAARYGDRFEGLPIAYVRQRERRGLAHALLAAAPLIDGPFVALHGDNLFLEGAAAFRPAVELRRERKLAASLVVERVAPGRAVRGACITGPDGAVLRVVERATPEEARAGLVVAGFYAFSPAVFDGCRAIAPSARGEYELPDAITWLIRRGHPVAASPLRGSRVNVNTPEDLARARRSWEERAPGTSAG